ncbi:MAG: DUF2339 domain-containing protein [Verrucomicrobiales bacterium]
MLFLSITFFVKYSFENNLIPPEGRVALGFAAGIGLLVGGFIMDRRKYVITSHTLLSTGILVLYATTFACRSIYGFLGTGSAFAVMVLITAVAFLLAVRLNAVVVAVLGLLGGFLTPILLSTGVDRPFALFGYIGLLNAGLLAVVIVKRWNFLAGLAAAATVMMQWGWFFKFFAVEKAWIAFGIFASFALLFGVVAFVVKRRAGLGDWISGSAAAMAASLFGFALACLSFRDLTSSPTVFLLSVLLGSVAAIALSVLQRERPHYHATGADLGFILIGAWLSDLPRGEASLLAWALAACFGFALLHFAAPMVAQRFGWLAVRPRWMNALPLGALVLVLMPVALADELSILAWPIIFAIGAIALAAAVLAGAAWIAAAAITLVLAALGIWIGGVESDAAPLGQMLLVIGVFAGAIFAATYFLRGRLSCAAAEGRADWESRLDFLAPHLPAASAAMPFLLLMMIAGRLPLAHPSPVFGLAIALAALLLGLAYLLPNAILPLIGLGSAAALQFVWQAAHLRDCIEAGAALEALLWHAGFFAVFAAFPFMFFTRFRDSLLPWIASALAGPLHFLLVHRLIKAAWPNEMMGLVPLAFTLPSLAAVIVLIRRVPDIAREKPAQLAWFGGVALFFITLIFPIQFSREWITLGWALEGAALLWLFRRVPHAGLKVVGVALLGAAFIRLAINPAVLSYHERGAAPIFNWYLYAFGVAAACQFAGAWLLRGRGEVAGVKLPPILCGLGTALVFLLVNIEIADFFTAEGERALTFDFRGNFARDMTYTIAWAAFALALIAVGLWKRLRVARLAALGLLGLALAKLFLHDLANLEALYRIGALIGTAAIAIVASFLYQKLLAAPSDDKDDAAGLADEPEPTPSHEDAPPHQ